MVSSVEQFHVGQRVRVARLDHPMVDLCGTVRRVRRPKDQAWVEMDDALPFDLRTFSKEDTRHCNYTLLWLDECVIVEDLS